MHTTDTSRRPAPMDDASVGTVKKGDDAIRAEPKPQNGRPAKKLVVGGGHDENHYSNADGNCY